MFWKNFFWLGKSFTIFLSLVLVGLIFTALNGPFGESITHLLWIGAGLTGFLLVFVIFIQLGYSYNWFGTPIVIKPLPNDNATTELGIIFIQGEEIPIDKYCLVAEAIQKAAPDLNIWVGIPKFIGNSPVPRETGLAIDQALRQMGKEGMSNTDNIFFAAHSVGGIAIQKYLKSFPERAKGQILMGSFLNQSHLSQLNDQGKTEIQYNVPTLTIGGTLDGLARITRIATGFWHQQINVAETTDKLKFPVVVIDGATHIQFASGEPTGYVKDFDLTPKFPEEKIHSQIGELVYNFICYQLQQSNGEASGTFLQGKCLEAQQMLQPIIDAFLKEGYNGFKPACYCNREDNPRPPAKDSDSGSESECCANSRSSCCPPQKCTAYSPWIEEDANPIMAGEKDLPISNAPSFYFCDNFHRSYTVTPWPPFVHIPKITKIGNKLKITSVTQALYHFLNFLDTGFFPTAAFSLRAKINSRQKIWQNAGVKDPNFEDTDGPPRGNEINQQVYQWALENTGAEAKQYFQKFGVDMVMGDDSIPIVAAGPLWVWVYPKYKYIRVNSQEFCDVRARVMKTPMNYPISSARGFHYCQLLSPAAAMEWIYVDGLRAQASVSGKKITYGLFAGGLGEIIRFLLRVLFRQTRTKGLFKK